LCILFGALLFVESEHYVSLVIIALMYASSGFFSFSGIWVSENYPVEYKATATNIVFFAGRIIGGFSPLIASLLYSSSLGRGIGLVGVVSGVIALVGVAIIFSFNYVTEGNHSTQKY
ncbi:MAG: hypothetical protein QXU98_07645, partial [Candidatus Parvarchaeota archaeon]